MKKQYDYIQAIWEAAYVNGLPLKDRLVKRIFRRLVREAVREFSTTANTDPVRVERLAKRLIP